MFSIVLLHVHVLGGGTRDDVIILIRDFAFPGIIMGSFFVIAVAFDRKPHRPLSEVVRARFTRLLVPSLAWTYLYWFGWWMVRPLLLGQAPMWPPVSLALTSYMHLWFLHMVFVVTVGCAPVLGWVSRGQLGRWPVAAVCALLTLVYPLWIEPRMLAAAGPDTYRALPGGAFPAPDIRQLTGLMAPFLPYIPAGIAIGLAHRTIRHWYSAPAFRAATLVAPFVLLAIHLSPLGGPMTRVAYSLAVFIAVLRPLPPHPFTMARSLARWSYVVYILHFAGAIVFASALKAAGVARTELTSLAGAVIVVGISLGAGYVLRRLLPVDWLLPLVPVSDRPRS